MEARRACPGHHDTRRHLIDFLDEQNIKGQLGAESHTKIDLLIILVGLERLSDT